MRAAAHVVARRLMSNNNMDKMISQLSTPPKGIRTIITIGELRGMIDIHIASAPSGLLMITEIIDRERIRGIVIGSTI